MSEHYITTEELAKRLKVSRNWIYAKTSKVNADPMPRVKIGKYLRFDWKKIQRWLKKSTN